MTALEEKQALLAHHVCMVARRLSHGLFVAGTGGVGKSKVIGETLASEGVVPVLINSHITPLSLYQTMYEHRQDKVLWLDDCDSIYPNMAILGLLRSALWGQGERIVIYTSTQLVGLPNHFEFDSRIIFTANSIPKRNEAFKYEPSLKKVEYARMTEVDWRDLVRSQLDQLGQKEGLPKPLDSKGHDMKCLALAVEKFPASVKQQEDFWREATGKSRASFFRTKKDFEASRQEDHP